jgi:hypothetical protein
MTNPMVKRDAELFALGYTKGREAETVRIAKNPDTRIKELQKRVKHLESGLNWPSETDLAAIAALQTGFGKVEIDALKRERAAMQARIRELEAALREIAAGLMPVDSVAGNHQRYELCAGRLCNIARDALTGMETGDVE